MHWFIETLKETAVDDTNFPLKPSIDTRRISTRHWQRSQFHRFPSGPEVLSEPSAHLHERCEVQERPGILSLSAAC